ncbi:laminin subunit gamma-1-like [Actinia tenebrosa]|uniref:Laminin subunit gamma-1-like n=1 Tax=Actinia tenebrosa TaxID=6105 RepID=A0A6P8H943_ACTTE|nr:laminin subunit gamma-1-like [Actinia tenebrosa]
MAISPGGNEIFKASDVMLEGRGRNVTLFMTPSPSPDTNSYHVVLDEEHVTPSNSVTPFEFQSILTNLTSIKVRALYFPGGSVSFKRISLAHAVKNETVPENMQVRFAENASCHQNYSGLSCETCAPGYKREILGDSPFGRCVLCSCNGRSTRCHPDTGVCTNCEVGTYGDRCEHCTNNVQGPDCTRCKTGYWGLSRSGCRACNCSAIGTLYGNTSLCDEVTGQCSCNASMNVEGRACDRCKETAYSVSGNSISDCRECPSCYKFIQSDVHKLRPQVAQTQNLITRIAQHPVMLSNKNFALRFNESVREVISLVGHASVAAQNDSAFRVHWTALGQAFDSLESLVKNNLSETVNASSLVALSARSNYQVIKETITKVVGLVKKAYRVLNTTVDQRTRLVGAQLDLLKEMAVNLDNLTRQALHLENSTLHANTTIHSGSQYAVARANLTAINARTVQESEDELSPYLEPLLRNATETKRLGEKAVAESLERLEKASSLLNQTRSLASMAATPNPDNTRTLNDLNMYLSNLDATTARYLNNTRTIFESSRPVVAQVNSAVVRAQDLVSKVSQVVENSTAQAASAESSNQIANSAINQANQVHHDATYMLDVIKNFESVSHEAILRANASLSKTDTLEQQLSEVIGNASSISVDVQDSVNASMRAIQLGGLSYHLADNESKVISEEFVRVKKLENDSHQADILLSNQSLREYIKRHIEPKENTCRNLTNKATNLSTQANALLHLANETNSKAQRVVEQTQRALNESKVLALDDPNNSIPELNQAIAKVRESFAALNLTANITQLRDSIQIHKSKFQQNQLRKNTLMLEIKRVRQLIDSFKEVNRECQK